MSEYLADEQNNNLRSLNIIDKNEVAMKVGDLYVAMNVLTNEKRSLSEQDVRSISSSSIREGKPEQKLLKD